jgi:hypothetical protein
MGKRLGSECSRGIEKAPDDAQDVNLTTQMAQVWIFPSRPFCVYPPPLQSVYDHSPNALRETRVRELFREYSGSPFPPGGSWRRWDRTLSLS